MSFWELSPEACAWMLLAGFIIGPACRAALERRIAKKRER